MKKQKNKKQAQRRIRQAERKGKRDPEMLPNNNQPQSSTSYKKPHTGLGFDNNDKRDNQYRRNYMPPPLRRTNEKTELDYHGKQKHLSAIASTVPVHPNEIVFKGCAETLIDYHVRFVKGPVLGPYTPETSPEAMCGLFEGLSLQEFSLFSEHNKQFRSDQLTDRSDQLTNQCVSHDLFICTSVADLSLDLDLESISQASVAPALDMELRNDLKLDALADSDLFCIDINPIVINPDHELSNPDDFQCTDSLSTDFDHPGDNSNIVNMLDLVNDCSSSRSSSSIVHDKMDLDPTSFFSDPDLHTWQGSMDYKTCVRPSVGSISTLSDESSSSMYLQTLDYSTERSTSSDSDLDIQELEQDPFYMQFAKHSITNQRDNMIDFPVSKAPKRRPQLKLMDQYEPAGAFVAKSIQGSTTRDSKRNKNKGQQNHCQIDFDAHLTHMQIKQFCLSNSQHMAFSNTCRPSRVFIETVAKLYGLKYKLRGSKPNRYIQLAREKQSCLPIKKNKDKLTALLEKYTDTLSSQIPRPKSSPDAPRVRVTPGYKVGSNAKPIDERNVGHRMLTMLGWVPGSSIGTRGNGIQAPISAVVRGRNKGLGS